MRANVKLPDFELEKLHMEKGYQIIAGVDEVGRGCFAGPVIAGCVVFDSDYIGSKKILEVLINDSKKMSAKQRELADQWIKDSCMCWGVGEASVDDINNLGIKPATEIAYRKAFKNANEKIADNIDFLLIDAFFAPNVEGLPERNQLPIIKGDAKSISIAAASIIAKVYRDKLMTDLAGEYVNYYWGTNKGYGTRAHIEAIKKYGPTKLHRDLFIRNCTR